MELAPDLPLISEQESSIPGGMPAPVPHLDEARNRLAEILGRCMNVVRNAKDLEDGIVGLTHLLAGLEEDGNGYEQQRLYNDCFTALAAMKAALRRTESIGCHIREDTPPPL